MPLKSTDPQLGPAMALVALRREFPQLPHISWSLTDEGHLFGTVRDPQVFAAYTEVFGGTPMGPIDYSTTYGGDASADELFVTWHDVEVCLYGRYTTHCGQVAA